MGKSNGLGTAGFVLSIITLLLSLVPIIGFFVCIPTWLLGLLFSFIGLFKSPRGLALAGFIISIFNIFVFIISFVVAFGAALFAV